MDEDIQLIADGDGLAVIGEPSVVEHFLSSHGLESRDLGMQRLQPAISAAAVAAQAGSEIAANSGRWVKLTKKSVEQINAWGLMKGSSSDVVRGVVQAKGGEIKALVEFSRHASVFTNPAVLAGVAGVMSQVAMQQQMDEISDYLAAIDKKVDDVLRAQKDAAVSDMIGVDFVVEEAMIIREEVGHVSDVTWSKVQSSSMVLARTQAYALRQLDALAEKLEKESNVDDLAKSARAAEPTVQEWLAVVAYCFRLQEAVSVLEIDRVLDATPEHLDQHRLGVAVAHQNRLDVLSRSTEGLIDRMTLAAGRANQKVLLNPISAPSAVRSSNRITGWVLEFRAALGLERGESLVEAKRWLNAAGDLRDRVLETGSEGVGLGKRFGTDTRDRARSLTNKIAIGVAERTRGHNDYPDQG